MNGVEKSQVHLCMSKDYFIASLTDRLDIAAHEQKEVSFLLHALDV